MRTSRSRIVGLLSVAILALAACGDDAADGGTDGGSPLPEDAPRVAMVHIAVVDESSWDIAGANAYDAMCEKYGFDCTKAELVTYEAAPGVLRDFGEQGYDMVITHSSGYASAIEEVAPDYPDTEFVLFSYAEDTKGLDNYSAWSMNWDQVGFAVGVLAGAVTDSGETAIVGGEKIPSTVRGVTFFEAGVHEVNPDAIVTPVWIGSWTDAARAYELTRSVIDDGVDFVAVFADLAGSGSQRAADEAGVFTHGEYIDQSDDYPNAIVTSYIVDMDGAFDEIGQTFVDGELEGQIVQMGVETGDLSFTPFENVDPEVEQTVNDALDGLASGDIKLPDA
jgi:basic membrane protein A